MTILNRLFTLAEGRAVLGDTHRVCFPVRADVLALADDMAEDIGLSRAQVLRECLEFGIKHVAGDWQSAKAAAAAEKKAAKQQQKLKLEGGEEK